jgi:hypothetical protein
LVALVVFEHSPNLFLVLPILIVLGCVTFLAGATFIVAVFARLRLSDNRQALGLPEGSVRALIALILIVVFFIFGNTIFGVMQGGSHDDFHGLTQSQIDRLEGNVVAQRLSEDSQGDEATFDGTFTKEIGGDAAALGQQLVTALVTLVATISAFYFGANSVKAATASAAKALGSPSDIVPYVIGNSLGQATARLRSYGYTSTHLSKASDRPADEVVGQDPTGGGVLPASGSVTLVVSSGPEAPAEP